MSNHEIVLTPATPADMTKTLAVIDANLQAAWDALQAVPSYVEQQAAAFVAETAHLVSANEQE